MYREVLIACLPYLGAMALLGVALRGLVWISGARPAWGRMSALHRDEQGAVQSLSFVLTLPIFVMVMLLIVQLTQLAMARVVVEYAAFSAARAAMVWIPASLGPGYEQANEIRSFLVTPPLREYTYQDNEYQVYRVQPAGEKFVQIHSAAAMACLPLAPSRHVGAATSHVAMAAADSLLRAYSQLAPASQQNTRVPTRLRNKLAYALANTRVQLEVHHKGQRHGVHEGDDPHLVWGENWLDRGPREQPEDWYLLDEIGWQDQLYLTVSHDFALLPGPARLLARRVDNAFTGPDRVADQIENRGTVSVRTIVATARLSNEGQEPMYGLTQWLPWGAGGFAELPPQEEDALLPPPELPPDGESLAEPPSSSARQSNSVPTTDDSAEAPRRSVLVSGGRAADGLPTEPSTRRSP